MERHGHSLAAHGKQPVNYGEGRGTATAEGDSHLAGAVSNARKESYFSAKDAKEEGREEREVPRVIEAVSFALRACGAAALIFARRRGDAEKTWALALRGRRRACAGASASPRLRVSARTKTFSPRLPFFLRAFAGNNQKVERLGVSSLCDTLPRGEGLELAPIGEGRGPVRHMLNLGRVRSAAPARARRTERHC